MTTTYTPTQTASFVAAVVNPAATSLPCSLGSSSAALYRFQLPTDIYFISTLTLTVTISGTFVGPTETFNVLLLTDPDAISALTAGTLAVTLCPSPAYTPGTAGYAQLNTTKLTKYGSVSFGLDLATVTRIMATSTSPTNIWNGSLLFWVVAAQTNATVSLATAATLTTYDIITYANRDTGSRGINSSRWTRCPVSGLKVPRGEMVLDGYRNILVAADSYDPPEPEARDWGDYGEPNEDN